jgi:glucose/mannose transport system substrate-binding protein
MPDRHVSRRTLLHALGVGAAGASSGCFDDTDSALSTTSEVATETSTTTAIPTGTTVESAGELEVTYPLCGGSQQAAIEALAEGYQESEYASDEVDIEEVCFGGSAYRSHLESRLSDGDPPGVWQDAPGRNLRRYLDDGALRNIGDVLTADVRSAYPSALLESATVTGTLVAVPVSLFRQNNLFYNVDVVERAGVDPAAIDTPSDLVDAFDAVERSTDATPFAHSTETPRTTLQLWETTLLGLMGAGSFRDALDGAPDADMVRAAFEAVDRYLDSGPKDAESEHSFEMQERLIRGDAAFLHKGHWAFGIFMAQDFEYETDWNHVPFPGTAGSFQFFGSAYLTAANGPSPGAAQRFLRYCATSDAQERFCAAWNTIPPRTDVDVSILHPFVQDLVEDYRSADDRIHSATYGIGVTPEVRDVLETVVDEFADVRDIGRATERVVETLRN